MDNCKNLPPILADKSLLVQGLSLPASVGKTETEFEGVTYAKRDARLASERFRGRLFLSEDEAESLLNFYRDELEDGTLTFNWKHPRTGDTIEVRWLGAPTLTPAGSIDWYVDGLFEIVG